MLRLDNHLHARTPCTEVTHAQLELRPQQTLLRSPEQAHCAGVIKFTNHNPTSVVPLVPGDLVANITLAATVATAAVPGS